LRVRWHTLLIAALTVALLWVFIASINLHEAWVAMTRADPRLIAAGLAMLFLTYVIRTVRWLVLLEPIGRAKFVNAFRTTVLGFAATAVLPARLGEVLRPYLLARREGFKPSSAFATIIVERLLDIATVCLLFAFALPIAGAHVGREVKLGGVVFAIGAVAGLVFLFVLAGHPERLRGLAERWGRRLPPRAGNAVAHFAQTFAEGLKVMRSPGHFAVAALWSVPVWVTIAAGIWFTSRAFDLTFSFVGSFLVVGCLTVGVAAPTPGGAGGFHGMYLLALTQFFAADKDVAGAAAIVLHAVSFGPVTIVGLIFMWQDGLTLARLKTMSAEAGK
jgi:uncharacterized protein (TIRG00374 family)